MQNIVISKNSRAMKITSRQSQNLTLRILRQRGKVLLHCSGCWLLLVSFLLALSAAPTSEAATGGKRGVSTMTVNLYVGGGTGRVLALNPADPGYITNLIATVTGIYYEIVGSQPQVRLEGVAEAIAARRPDLVSVEEASLIRTESPGDLVFAGPIWRRMWFLITSNCWWMRWPREGLTTPWHQRRRN